MPRRSLDPLDDFEPEERYARARLREIMRERGATLSGLARLIGRNPAYFHQYINRGSPRHLDEPDLLRIAEFLGVEAEEIATRDVARRGARRGTGGSSDSANADFLAVPRLTIEASAGPGAFGAEEISYDTFRFSRRWLKEQGLDGAQLSAIAVKGDSMEPLLADGDEILIDRTPRPFRDGVHVVRFDDTLMVKRIARGAAGRFSLLSQNMAYPPIDVAADEIEIIGRVVWKGGRI
ncbi:LexA family transcriptional regulator [Erythrobacter sp.]|jgi:phage repressor protein C with HTH and peptisase S24 domain|uniref:LexA family transcriptional regulator n=1 Tax=Erythrobacter sp. TaxID=1042 RepID=UPI002ECF5909|nr:LexA family transcriptional regulator [Erythrobacter sp.]